MRDLIPIAGLLFCMGCAHPVASPVLSWDFEARPTYGEVRVLPVVIDVNEPDLSRDSFVGAGVSLGREIQRRTRTLELASVPREVGVAVPGAVYGELGPQWSGQFHVARFPVGTRDKVRAAIRGRQDLEEALGEVAVAVGGDASLFVWVIGLHGTPLSVEGFPGELVVTDAGPFVIDHGDEAYRVVADVGLALVAADGEVVIRYVDAFEAVLSNTRDAAGVGRELARALAREVATVWPCDPRLAEAEPASRY